MGPLFVRGTSSPGTPYTLTRSSLGAIAFARSVYPLASSYAQLAGNWKLATGGWQRLGPPFQKGAQLPRSGRVAELAQRLGFDLADALAGDREVLADLLERVLAAVADAEPHLDHLLLARRQRLEHRLGLLLEVEIDHRVRRRHHLAVFDEVAKMRILLLADRRFERDRLLRDLEDLAHLRYRDVHALGDLFRRRLASEL